MVMYHSYVNVYQSLGINTPANKSKISKIRCPKDPDTLDTILKSKTWVSLDIIWHLGLGGIMDFGIYVWGIIIWLSP